MVVSVHHGLVTSRNGTRNRGYGSCCYVRFRVAIGYRVATMCAINYVTDYHNHTQQSFRDSSKQLRRFRISDQTLKINQFL
ncbi:hypothetical protein Hanom_Chr04g00384331 [Helianthus anomalus]